MKYKYLLFIAFSFWGSALISQSGTKTNKDLPCLNKTFQIHAHVFLDSLGVAIYTPEQLASDIEIANGAFAPICVDFNLCGIDTITNYEYDSLGTMEEQQELVNLFHKKNRINVYLISQFQDPDKCGEATTDLPQNNSVIWLKCFGGTLVHELGHLFGLSHTFGGDEPELVNGSNCETAGDKLCDTPADPYVINPLIKWTDGCEFVHLKKDANGQFYNPDTYNIMSYYPCACRFTQQQFRLMAETYLSNKSNLW